MKRNKLLMKGLAVGLAVSMVSAGGIETLAAEDTPSVEVTQQKEFTITFAKDGTGNPIKTVPVNAGDRVDFPTNEVEVPSGKVVKYWMSTYSDREYDASVGFMIAPGAYETLYPVFADAPAEDDVEEVKVVFTAKFSTDNTDATEIKTVEVKNNEDGKIALPKVDAPAGKKLVGWGTNLDDDTLFGADVDIIDVSGYIEAGRENGSFWPVYADVEKEAETVFTARFSTDNTDATEIKTVKVKNNEDGKIALPKVDAPAGKKLVGWGTNLDDDTLFGADVDIIDVSGYIKAGRENGSFWPVYADAEKEAETVFTARFSTDNTDTTEVKTVKVKDNEDGKIAFPEVEVPEGKKLVGWGTNLDNDALFGADVDIIDVSGYIEAGYENGSFWPVYADVEKEAETVFTARFSTDNTDFVEIKTVEVKDNEDGKIAFPEVEVPEGKKLVGWGTNLDNDALFGADVDIIDVSGYIEAGYEYGSFWPVYEDVKEDDADVDPVKPGDDDVDPVKPGDEKVDPAEPGDEKIDPAKPADEKVDSEKADDNKKADSAKKDTEEKSKTVKTGDNASIFGYALSLVVAAAAAVLLTIRRRIRR